MCIKCIFCFQFESSTFFFCPYNAVDKTPPWPNNEKVGFNHRKQTDPLRCGHSAFGKRDLCQSLRVIGYFCRIILRTEREYTISYHIYYLSNHTMVIGPILSVFYFTAVARQYSIVISRPNQW